jgi:hypothetical protein
MPFGPYADFEECVADNQDKASPEGFCAWLHYEITGAWPSGVKDKESTMLEALKTKDDFLLAEALLKNPDLSIKQVEGIIETYNSWAGDFEGCVDELSGKPGITNPEALCVWLHHESTGQWPAEKSIPDWAAKYTLAGPFVLKDNAKRIVTAPVLVPGEPDADGEVVNKDTIESVALEFMEKYQLVDVGHTFNQTAVPVESWILRKAERFENMILPEGTWMMSAKINDDSTWEGILSGKFKGFSITGVRRDEAQAIKSKDSKKDKTLLSDLGDDWLVATVSIVENPAVWKAKWVAIKATKEPSLLSRVKARLNKLTGKSNQKTMEDIEMNKEEITQIVKDAVKAEIAEVMKGDDETETTLKERIEALEQKLETAAKDEDGTETEKDDKADKGIDLSEQINGVKMELLDLYEQDPDEERDNKIGTLKQKLEFYQELSEKKSGKDKDDKPDDIEAMKAKIADLDKRLSTKSRGLEGQDGHKDKTPSTIPEIKRDGLGRRIRV